MSYDGSIVSEGFQDIQHKNVNESLFKKYLKRLC